MITSKCFVLSRRKTLHGKRWWAPPHLSSLIIFDIWTFLKLRRDLLREFPVKWDEKFANGESRHARPSSSETIFNNRKYLRHRTVAVRNVLTLWDKTISMESLDGRSLPSWSWKFSIPENFRNTEGFIYEFTWYCVTKQYRGKIVIPHFYPKNLFLPDCFWNAKWFLYSQLRPCETSWFNSPPPFPWKLSALNFPLSWSGLFEVIRYSKTKNFRRKVMIGTPAHLILNKFGYRAFFVIHKGSPKNHFSKMRRKIFGRRTVIGAPAPPWHKKFSLTNFIWDQKGLLYQIYGHCEKNQFDGKSWWALPPVFILEFYDTKFFSKHRKVPLRFYSVLCDKIISKGKRDTPLLSIKSFHTRLSLKHKMILLRSVTVVWGKTNSTEGLDILPPPLFFHKNFPYQNVSQTLKGSSRKFMVLWDRTFRKKIVITSPPSLIH